MKIKTIYFIFLLLYTSISLSQNSKLKSGPMVGFSEMTEVLLWAQTSEKATVQFRYWDKLNSKNKFLSVIENTNDEKYFTAKIILKNLQPGTFYNYEILINGKVSPKDYELKFQTQKYWQWRTPPPDFSFVFGSCVYVNDIPFERPSGPYGADVPTFQEILKQNPDFMLWLGDNIYYREGDWNTKSGMTYRYTHSRSHKSLQPVLGSIHNYAIWDDHDYGRDNDDRSYRMKDVSLDLFKNFWGNNSFGLNSTPGVFGRFTWSDAEFFLLDDRYYRSPNNSPNDENKTMFGKEQFNWLKDVLINSDATFKFIVNGNQILNTNSKKECLNMFPNELKELLGFLKNNKIKGVIFLSGDLHYSEVLQHTDSTFYTLYEVTSSSLTAGLDKNPLQQNSLRVANTLVNDKHNFSLVKIKGPKENRVAEISLVDFTGTKRWQIEIAANSLRFTETKAVNDKK
ncbi:MAG: alkaline phosphatase D family protein [Bacteroidetes bacterium]|nr:alkaline phosphatase D family protein [Bacteroidota bacterium]